MENQAVQKSKREKLTLQDRPREPDSTDLNRTVKFTQQENWDELNEKLASEAESAEQIERKVYEASAWPQPRQTIQSQDEKWIELLQPHSTLTHQVQLVWHLNHPNMEWTDWTENCGPVQLGPQPTTESRLPLFGLSLYYGELEMVSGIRRTRRIKATTTTTTKKIIGSFLFLSFPSNCWSWYPQILMRFLWCEGQVGRFGALLALTPSVYYQGRDNLLVCSIRGPLSNNNKNLVQYQGKGNLSNFVNYSTLILLPIELHLPINNKQ